MGSPVAHFEILGNNPAGLRAFYTGVFGWGLAHPEAGGSKAGEQAPYTMITTNSGSELAGGIGQAQRGPDVKFYMGVEDLDATRAAIEARGGAVVMAPRQVEEGGVHIALFSDPEGNVLGLVKG